MNKYGFTLLFSNSSSSLSEYVYYVSFIDDFSQNTWILKRGDEVFRKFNVFKSLVKNHTKRNIKTMQSNNGGEFTSKEFKEIYKELGIKRDLSTPYNPQQNGISE